MSVGGNGWGCAQSLPSLDADSDDSDGDVEIVFSGIDHAPSKPPAEVCALCPAHAQCSHNASASPHCEPFTSAQLLDIRRASPRRRERVCSAAEGETAPGPRRGSHGCVGGGVCSEPWWGSPDSRPCAESTCQPRLGEVSERGRMRWALCRHPPACNPARVGAAATPPHRWRATVTPVRDVSSTRCSSDLASRCVWGRVCAGLTSHMRSSETPCRETATDNVRQISRSIVSGQSKLHCRGCYTIGGGVTYLS
jgi:hypothetical protein